MADTSTRTITIVYSGDTFGTQVVEAATNAAAPNSVEIRTLASGFNAITVPTGGSTVTALTILPPVGNTTNMTLKGVTGDTGLQMHDTDPTSLSIDPSVTSIGITTAAQITGVRLYWS